MKAMRRFEVLKEITDIKAFSSLIFDLLKNKETSEEIENLLSEKIPA